MAACAGRCAETAARLAALGIGAGDRVAIVLPNGPEMATAFVSVAAAATTAPLNPAYRADELDFYLTDIGAKAILVGEDEDGPAVAVAERLGIAVLRLVSIRHARPGPSASSGDRRRHRRRERLGDGRRRRAAAAHLGHHLAAEARAAQPRQPRRLGAQHRRARWR